MVAARRGVEMVEFLFILAFMYVTILLQGWAGITILIVTLGAKNRRSTNISHLQIAPSPKLQSTIDKLLKLRFTPAGQVRVHVAGVQSGDTRVFVSPDRSTHAEVTEVMTDMVQFTTVYADHAVVETIFPMGERIDTPTFRSHTITSDIEKAYLHHLQQVADFSKSHGIPRHLESMNDYLHWDVVYRERYIWQKFRRNFWMGAINVISLIYAILATLIVVEVSFLRNGSAWSAELLLPLMVVITPAAIITSILPWIAKWTGRREAKPA
jgi:hypothetical protein